MQLRRGSCEYLCEMLQKGSQPELLARLSWGVPLVPSAMGTFFFAERFHACLSPLANGVAFCEGLHWTGASE